MTNSPKTQKEIWRTVPSVPDYIASSLGRVMRLPFVGTMPHGGIRPYGGEPIYGVVHEKNSMRPTIHHKGKNIRVSRMVCEAFHGQRPFPKAVVMHLDDNPSNNKPENLKWGSQKENLNSPKFLAYCRSRTGENSPTIKAKMKQRA